MHTRVHTIEIGKEMVHTRMGQVIKFQHNSGSFLLALRLVKQCSQSYESAENHE